MKSIRTEPHGYGSEGDERIRTAVPAPGDDLAYEAHIQDRPPNFRDEDGHLFLVRCFVCSETEHGRENWAMAVASGQCAWCGWKTRLAEADRG